MKLTPLDVHGAFLVEIEPRIDERGFFARTWCRQEFEACGIDASLVQCNVSRNKQRGTLRGLHFQTAPHEESKLARCTLGAIFDVIVDVRPESPTYLRWCGFELSAENHRALFIPKGTAHGFLTLTDQSEVFYQMSDYYAPAAGQGARWNDPAFSIDWPLAKANVRTPLLSERDATYPDFHLAIR